MKKVYSGENCPVCGDEFVIHTKAKQDLQEHESYRAFDGDKAECPDCGFLGWVSVDDQIAYINYDELSEHNVECSTKHEVKGTLQ